MRATTARSLGLPLLAAALLATACNRGEETPAVDTAAPTTAAPTPAPAATQALSVTNVTLGKRVDGSAMVAPADTASTFGRRDTIYASVQHTGQPSSATLAARWVFQDGQVVDSTARSVTPTGPGATEFHIAKASPWPAGSYRVEILVDGQVAQTKQFTIR
jgi:hypothetical protein